MTASRPRFIADCMLGKLARWLRILGFDAAYERRISDEDLIGRARSEGRILLTRDTRLVQRRTMPPHLLVASQEAAEQIRQTMATFHLKVDRAAILSRCLICNEPTAAAAREEVRDLVPPYVYRTQRRFSRCSSCGRIYWRATHVAGILDSLDVAVGEASPSAERAAP